MKMLEGFKMMFGIDSGRKKEIEAIKMLDPEQQKVRLSRMLYDACVKCSADFVNEEIARAESPFRGIDRNKFLHEIMILTLWIADKAAGGKKKTAAEGMNSLYINRFAGNSAIEDETEAVRKRHSAYSSSWDDVSGHQDVFGFRAAEFIFDGDKGKLRPDITFWLILYADSAMKTFSKIREQCLNCGVKL